MHIGEACASSLCHCIASWLNGAKTGWVEGERERRREERERRRRR